MTTNGKHTFLDMDVGKAFAGFNFPGLDIESVVAAQRKNLEALTQANQLAVEGVQAVARRQVEIARETVDEVSSLVREWTQPGAPEERIAKHAEYAKQAFEKGVANARELAELVTKANTEAFSVIQKRVAEGFEELRDYAKQRATR
ncbi:MAG TPA: phasin family protein [Stellaceae bacterium]|jgi:phasin family protein|nr:phasin family protein [Stellaceae bacterium]